MNVTVSSQIFRQNQAQIFELFSENEFHVEAFLLSSYENVLANMEELKNYFETHTHLVYIFYFSSFFIAIFVLYFNSLYQKRNLFVKEDSYTNKNFFFISVPLSTYIILLSLAISIIFIDRPKSLVDLLIVIVAIPSFRIISVFINADARKYFAIFFSLFILFLVNKNSIGYALDASVVSFFISGGLLYFLITILKSKTLDFISNDFIQSFGYKVVYLFIFLLSVSMFANLYGAVLLSSRIISGIFITVSSALIFYAIFNILSGYTLIILRRRMATASNARAGYSKKIEISLAKIIKAGMFLWWIVIVFKSFIFISISS